MVYSRSQEVHEQHFSIVLHTLREKKLYAEFSKCEFWIDSMAFLGNVAYSKGIKVDPKKIEEVQSWPRPSLGTEIQSFLGLARYYCRFMEGFSSIAAPVTRLTQKGALFRWSNECEESFQKLKTALTTTIEGRVIAYALYQLKPHEKNYPVHDLELAGKHRREALCKSNLMLNHCHNSFRGDSNFEMNLPPQRALSRVQKVTVRIQSPHLQMFPTHHVLQ
ncbi:uncharacterized mitochondrial protein AtMg00860-like [Nicotiana sylvestris]|uniref:uncharacterized mitochondrial protein AtMg00860-like n=1 Tax=Nicotiana sylvestris TaxID=4096 RepID=UPI00388CD9BA